MIEGVSPLLQGLLGTLFTWGVTALGAALVYVIPPISSHTEGKVLDASLGFAAGVMLAASYWSLLAPSIELSESLGYEDLSYLPASVGFILGSLFVWFTDIILPEGSENAVSYLTEKSESAQKQEPVKVSASRTGDGLRFRGKGKEGAPQAITMVSTSRKSSSWRRIMLLVLAITIHNFPEGLAVGVGFGAIGKTAAATFASARNLAVGIGIQNFPEGLAVSLPLRRLGYSKHLCFFYGQLSGVVEPIGGLLGAGAVVIAEPILPYALAFAAGAMVFVVCDAIVPEAHSRGNGRVASWGAIIGFVVMMTLDVALG